MSQNHLDTNASAPRELAEEELSQVQGGSSTVERIIEEVLLTGGRRASEMPRVSQVNWKFDRRKLPAIFKGF